MDEFIVVLISDVCGCVSVNVCSIVCETIGLGEYRCADGVGWCWVWWDDLVRLGAEQEVSYSVCPVVGMGEGISWLGILVGLLSSCVM